MEGPSPLSGSGVSVEADWFGSLPAAKMQAFIRHSKELESPYLMFSVVLDEAISLRKSDSRKDSLKDVVLASTLCVRLIERLKDMLSSLAEHSREHGTAPNITWFDPAAFLTPGARHSAGKGLLAKADPSSPQERFLQKVHALELLVDNIGSDFCTMAKELALSPARAMEAASLWEALDASHFDLNTCLRELIVMLKCFFRALPMEQLQMFEVTASGQKAPTVAGAIILRHRRAG